MTRVVFFVRADGWLTGFEASGHSGYASSGKDIVCAAISALTQAALGGLTDVVGAPVTQKMDEDTGYLFCEIDGEASGETMKSAQILLKTLKMALNTISNDYPGTIRIISRERR